MNRRVIFSGASVTAALFLGAAFLSAQTHSKEAGVHPGKHSGMEMAAFKKCAEACGACQRECDGCSAHCAMLLGEGKKEHQTTIASCVDCAEVCSAASRILSRRSIMAPIICEACTKACIECRMACEKFPDDEHMKKCADECTRCEKVCKSMSASTPSRVDPAN